MAIEIRATTPRVTVPRAKVSPAVRQFDGIRTGNSVSANAAKPIADGAKVKIPQGGKIVLDLPINPNMGDRSWQVVRRGMVGGKNFENLDVSIGKPTSANDPSRARNNGSQRMEFDTSNSPPGTYAVRIQKNQGDIVLNFTVEVAKKAKKS